MEEMLRAALASYEEDLVAFTKALIVIPTENPPGLAYHACVDLLTQKLAEIELDYTLLEVPAPTASFPRPAEAGYCVFSSYGTGQDMLYFHGHYDVVPAVDLVEF